jgi:transposase
MISRLDHTALIPTVYASRVTLPSPMQDSFPAGWLTFTGRESNPLGFNERFQFTYHSPFPDFPDASWAHARRYFVDAEAAIPKHARGPRQLATRFIAAIGKLYLIESQAKDAHPEQRQQLRQTRSREILTQIETLLLQHLHSVLPGSLMGKALHYLSAQWPKLIRFVENGHWPIDNNACENAIRPFVVGRRNWLFSDTVGGAQASANLYSLIETCKANGREPYEYLIAIFRQLALAKTAEDFEALLPWNFTPDVIG